MPAPNPSQPCLMSPLLLLMFHFVLFRRGPSAKPSGLDRWFRRCHSADSSHRALSADRGGGVDTSERG